MKLLFGIFIGVAIAAVVGAAYFAGGSFTKKQTQEDQSAQSISQIASPSPTPKPTKTISAGGILSFSAYTITFPIDWIDTQETGGVPGSEIETVKLTKGENYEIKIYEAATGGAICLYPGEAEPEGPSGKFTEFAEITTKGGDQFRRSGEAGAKVYTVCEKLKGTWQQPTIFGHITYRLPVGYDQAILAEMDLIIASLAKK